MKFPVLWSGMGILATIKLLYNPRANIVFTHSLAGAVLYQLNYQAKVLGSGQVASL